MALGSYGLNEPTSFGQSTKRLEPFLVGCFKNLLEKTKVVVQTNPIPIQTKVEIESMKQAAKRPKPPLPSDGSNSTSSDFDQVFTSICQFFFNIVVKTQG